MRSTLLSGLFLLLVLGLSAQRSNLQPRYEMGFDLLPIIVTGSTNLDNRLGVELFLTKTTDFGKLRFRYLLNQRGYYNDNTILERRQRALSNNITELVENRYAQQLNHGVRLGFEQLFRTSRVDYYWAIELHGQMYRAQIVYERLVQSFAEPDSEPEILESRTSPFANYEVGIVPTIGLGFNLDERIRIRVEMGPKLSMLFEKTPIQRFDGEMRLREGVYSSSELFLLNDILLSYAF